jgi:hypothetical protein
MLGAMGEREEIIAVASTYLDAGLVNDDADGVLLAPECRRWTQQSYHSPPRNQNAEEIRAGIRRGDERGIWSIDRRRWIVEGNQAVVLADLHFKGLEEPVILYERFTVEDGLIREIEAIFLAPERAAGR